MTASLKGDVARYMSGAPVPIRQCGMYVTPPTIYQIEQFGEDDFLTGVKIMTASREFTESVRKSNDGFDDAPDLVVVLAVVNADGTVRQKMLDFMSFIFPDYEVRFSKGSVDFLQGDDGSVKGQINPYNFEYFSYTVKELFWPPEKKEAEFNPANKKAEEIARKLEAARKRNAQQQGTAGGGDSLFGMYASVLSIGLGVSLRQLYEYTPFQLFDSFNRYVLKIQYDLYMKIKTTPMMSTGDGEEPEQWMNGMYRRIEK